MSLSSSRRSAGLLRCSLLLRSTVSLTVKEYRYPQGPDSSCAQSLTPDPERFGVNDPFLHHAREDIGVPLLLYSSYLCVNDTANSANYPGVDFVSSRYFDVGWARGNISVPAAQSSLKFYRYVMIVFFKMTHLQCICLYFFLLQLSGMFVS